MRPSGGLAGDARAPTRLVVSLFSFPRRERKDKSNVKGKKLVLTIPESTQKPFSFSQCSCRSCRYAVSGLFVRMDNELRKPSKIGTRAETRTQTQRDLLGLYNIKCLARPSSGMCLVWLPT
jgi:hypothetical protein